MGNMEIYKEQTTVVPNYSSLDLQFKDALEVVDDIVFKNYIIKLNDLEVIPMDESDLRNNVDNVRFFKITEMVYEKDEYSTHKFTSVFNSLSTVNASIFIIMDSDGEKTDFYMGIKSMDENRTTISIKETLKNAMLGQFPGIKTQEYLKDDMLKLLKKIKSNSISSVSCVANNKDDENKENQSFVQGLEKLALSMQGEKYTGIIVANSTKQDQIVEIRKLYEQIFTNLSPFANSQINYSINNSINTSKAFNQGITKGTSYTKNNSYTHGESESIGTSTSDGVSKQNLGSKVVNGLAAATGMLGSALALTPIGVPALVVGGVVSSGLGMVGNAIASTETHTDSTSSNFSKNSSSTKGESFSKNESKNEGVTDTSGTTSGNSQAITLNLQDKSIINTLDKIDTQLDRLKEFESLGMWECAAYFLSESPYAAEIAASTYKSIMSGENSGIEVSAINSWGKSDLDKTNKIRDYVVNFTHPTFLYENKGEAIPVTPCTFVSGRELSIHMGLPRKSVCGFPVIEHTDFGKEVVSYSKRKLNHSVNLGNIFNMGSECASKVKIDINSLAMHTSIFGSTGSGKSNTVYEMIDQLDRIGIKFLIIEPAKGEYKNIFGNRKDVRVLSTNPKCSELLKINPFKFPKEVHVLEHIDKLIEIFNVCWPMYAAMPAVLKEAILQSYELCGWDLVQSENKYSDNIFPTFTDIKEELVNVIEKSAYSEELKGNYIGSLVTRITSLTNGLNGQIFSSDEIDSHELFDKNVIIDLSRVGSLETKSLIMGILIMKLNEHRISSAEGMNQPLKHVTVLEEAHNILKSTQSSRSVEGNNIGSKSVEMLSNSIAEMRTYGEGFIISDQSPSAVDVSAIRNTNTKIIMRLPDEADRRLAGKSAALKDHQLDEVAKLPKGVAVVYQNDWIEPVLCKINKFDEKEELYKYEADQKKNTKKNNHVISEILKLLLKPRISEEIEISLVKEDLELINIPTKSKLELNLLMKEYESTGKLNIWDSNRFDELSKLVTKLLNCKSDVENIIQSVENFTILTDELSSIIKKQTYELNNEVILSICQCLLKDYSNQDDEKLEIYAAWRVDIDKRGIL